MTRTTTRMAATTAAVLGGRWLLTVTTGMRRGEIAGLRAEDIDLDGARVSPIVTRVVVDGRARPSEVKTHAGERSIALDPATVAAMRLYIDSWRHERRLLGQDEAELFVPARRPPPAPRLDHPDVPPAATPPA